LQVRFGNDRPDLLLQLFDMRLQTTEPRHTIQHHAELIRSERLGQVVESPSPHRLDRRLDGRVGGNDHDSQPRRQPQQRGQYVQPLPAAQAQVQKRDVKQHVSKDVLCLPAVTGFRHLVTHRLQGKAERLAQVHVVINEEDIHTRLQSEPTIRFRS
jgi:hypothetical protein